MDATSGPAHIKFFVKAISSTHDEVALTKETAKKLTPPHNVPAIRKTYLINIRELVPNFAARWHLFCEYFFTQENQKQDIITKATIYIETTRLHLRKKIQTTRKSQPTVIKRPNHLMKEQNTDTLSLKLCMPHQAPLILKFL